MLTRVRVLLFLAVAAVLALAAPAGAPAAGGPAGAAPEIQITYNTSEILSVDMNPEVATVTRGAATIATGAFDGDPVVTEFGLNSSRLAIDGAPNGCWDAFTPQILPGDVVSFGPWDSATIPDITAEPPVVEGNEVVVHGTATRDIDPAVLSAQLRTMGGPRFSGIGSAGGQILDASAPRGFNATFSFDDATTTHWTARYSGLSASDLAIASLATAVVEYDPSYLAAVDPPVRMLVSYQAGATPGPAVGCGSPYAPNEATAVSDSVVDGTTDLVVTGVSQPGASATSVTLTDVDGKTISAVPSGVPTWSATFAAADLDGLAEGPLRVGSTFSGFAGRTVTDLVRKGAGAAPRETTLLSGTAAAGGTIAAPGGEVSITTPSGGALGVTSTSGTTTTAPTGWSVLGREMHITAPAESADAPLKLVFTAALPADVDWHSVTVLRDGQPAPDCTGPAGTADPDPCVADRRLLADSSVQLTVLSVHASTWNIVRRAPVAINGGAQFAGDRHVKLDLVAPAGATTVTVSNDPRFRGAKTFPVAPSIPWSLDASGTVYVRFGNGPDSFQDDVVVDTKAPELATATLAAGDVSLDATDATSGLAQAQFGSEPGHPGAVVTYASQLPLPTGARFVRVRDGAGNWSRWLRIKG